MITPGVHFDIPRADYNAHPAYNQSRLVRFMQAESPAHFRAEELEERKVSRPMKLGLAVEALHDGTFNEKFIVEPEKYPAPKTHKDVVSGKIQPGSPVDWSNNAKFCKAWKTEQEERGAMVVKAEDKEKILGMVNALAFHPRANPICLNSYSQVVVTGVHPKLGLPMKGLLDFLPGVTDKWVYDLKTTACAAPSFFHNLVFEKRYDVQAAVYLDLCNLVGMAAMQYFCFICVESSSPYGIAFHWFHRDSDEIVAARADYEAAMAALAECDATNHWPGYPDIWCPIKAKPWQRKPKVKFEGI